MGDGRSQKPGAHSAQHPSSSVLEVGQVTDRRRASWTSLRMVPDAWQPLPARLLREVEGRHRQRLS